jgi:hypothetical protein
MGGERSRSAGALFGYGRITAALLVLSTLGAATLIGAPYYLMSPASRLRSPLHPWFKPTGYVGQTAGIVALALFLFLWVYPLRKKFRLMAFTGGLARWLDVHIVIGLLVPLVAAVHASWRFEGLIGLGYVAMLTVCASGVMGRYLYVRIPRGRQGLELSAAEVDRLNQEWIDELARSTGLDGSRVESDIAEVLGTANGGFISHLLLDDWVRWRAVRKLKRRWQATAVGVATIPRDSLRTAIRLARRRMALTQRARILDATRRVFGYWHVAHRPVAITALVAVLIHVGVAVALGVTWLW